MKKNYCIWTTCMLSCLMLGLTACHKSKNDGGDLPKPQTGKYVIVASEGEASYLLQTDDITKGQLTSVKGGIQTDAATHWLFPQQKYAYGLRYRQGNPGVMASFVLNDAGNLTKRSIETETPRFTAFGTSGQYLLLGAAAATVSDGTSQYPPYGVNFTVIDAAAQSKTEATFVTEDLLGNGEYCTVSGFESVNNRIYTAICPSGYSAYGIDKGKAAGFEDLITKDRTGASSISLTVHPDEVWIGIYSGTDKFKEKPVLVKDDRISYATSRFRSQYFPTICIGSDRYLYVFSNSGAKANTNAKQKTTKDAGVIRLNTTTGEFDKNYYYNIENITKTVMGEPHSFYQVWHVADNKFLIRLFDKAQTYTYGNDSPANTFGIFDANNGTLNLLKGFPATNEISDVGRFIYTEDGKAYLSVTLKDKQAAVYIVDSKTATAAKGITVVADGGIITVHKMYK